MEPLSIKFRVEDSLLSRASYKLLASVITGPLCCFSNILFHITQAFPRGQKQSVKHFGKFQHVKCFHVSLSLTSKGTAHNTFTLVTLPVHHSRRFFKTIQDEESEKLELARVHAVDTNE